MTTARPSLLIIMNQPLSGCLGQVDGYERLVASGDLEFVETVAMNGFREGARDQTSVDRVTTALRSSSATHVMVWSPGLFPNDFRDVDKLDDALAGRPLIYWEGMLGGTASQLAPKCHGGSKGLRSYFPLAELQWAICFGQLGDAM